jgi:putative Mg2+ transporter-C (MgtC) family protein
MQIVLDTLNNWDTATRAWAAGMGFAVESALRLVLAVVAGGLVGLEREVRGRQAGFRTYILVCLGSALVMIVSTEFARHAWPNRADGINLNIDPARIAYGVMTGVGFLGAGTIIHNRGSIRGLTTAAGLWCVAAVGLAVGVGIYLLAAVAVLLMLAALWILDYAEDMIPKLRYRTVRVRTRYRPGCVADTVKRFKKGGLHVVDAAFERSADLASDEIDLHIAFVNSDQYYNLERELEADPDYHLLTTRELG